ncbi:MAG: prolipoprotein diacylglyceryl transferase [Anaerofustis stercorihominis]|nr:prolipoprotein diacylglyceryl transferase [Anaerofustis stercorihominis]
MPDPIAFEIFGFEVRWYALVITIGVLLGLTLVLKRSEKYGIKEDHIYDIFIVAVPLAIIGARAYYVFFEWDYYSLHPEKIIQVWKGGLAIHGGIFFGMLAVWLVCRYRKISFLKTLDLLAPSLILGQAIGRWGNYFNMEAYGTETTLPWAITVYEAGKGYINVHPTFLYESLWNIGVFLILMFVIERKKKFDGQTACTYFILYSLGRFFIEGLRTDSLYIMGLRTAQLVSLGLIAVGILGYIILGKKNKTNTEAHSGEESQT